MELAAAASETSRREVRQQGGRGVPRPGRLGALDEDTRVVHVPHYVASPPLGMPCTHYFAVVTPQPPQQPAAEVMAQVTPRPARPPGGPAARAPCPACAGGTC